MAEKMTEKTSKSAPRQDVGAKDVAAQDVGAKDVAAQDVAAQDVAAMPVRLVRGTASPDEFSALVAVVAVLATAGGDGEPDPTDPTASAGGKPARSLWSSPARMVRGSHPHGPGGWRASASPR